MSNVYSCTFSYSFKRLLASKKSCYQRHELFFLLFVNYCDHAHRLREIRALKPCTIWKSKCTSILPYLYICPCVCILGFTSTCIWKFWFWAFLLLLFQYWWNKKIKGISSQLCLFICIFFFGNLIWEGYVECFRGRHSWMIGRKNIFDGKPWPMTIIEDVVLFLKESSVLTSSS